MNGLRNARLCGSGFTLTTRSDSVGYSIVKPPWPIVLSTETIAWHATQPRPTCDSGRLMIFLIGVSIRPLKSTAGSWQPPHHFDGFTPTTSCMYSMLLRYHWLLKDEKWCAEPNHWW